MGILIEISGPPGSGKTQAAAIIIHALIGKSILHVPPGAYAPKKELDLALEKYDVVITEKQT